MRIPSAFLLAVCSLLGMGCAQKSNHKHIVVKNTLSIDRSHETVSLDLTQLGVDNISTDSLSLGIIDTETQKAVIIQLVDNDGDNIADELLFQPEIKALAEKTYEVFQGENTPTTDQTVHCFSRFVPERTDDYAWENNRVAFRTYGPKAQKMNEEGNKAGTLSSGIDAWLKRVDYPIIDKWYKKELETDGSYHKDTGEGLDNFHVGPSRGVGGTAVKKDSIYYFSKNYVSWKRLYNGPIRTSFILKYADWDAEGNAISEEKHISLDYGSNLTRFEIIVKGTDVLSAGLTLHKNEGAIGSNEQEGWVSYWEPHEDSELGMGIVAPQGTMVGHEKYLTERKDESNLYAQLKAANGKVVYYAGFGWKKSGQFDTQKSWEAYLSDYSKKINSPLEVSVQ